MKYQIMMDILFTLLAKKKVTAGELAHRHDVSIRSIYRYIDELTVAGVPIDVRHGRGGGIYISDSFKLPVNFMTKEEYDAAIGAMKVMEGQLSNKHLLSAIDKLSSRQKAEDDSRLAAFGNVIVDSSGWGDFRFNDKITLLQHAIEARERLTIEYVTRSGEHSNREIEPYTLIYKQNVWYVYAFCQLRKEFRLFKIGRIRTMRLTGKVFERIEITKEQIPLHFSQETCPTVFVTLQISPDFLPDVEEWLGVECISEENGKHVARVQLPQDNGLVPKILSFGTGIKVTSPKELQLKVLDAAKEIISRYE